jgi:transposase, IS30 family
MLEVLMVVYVPVVVRREFWRLVGEGVVPSVAGVAVGVSGTSGLRWFREAGGMSPVVVGGAEAGSGSGVGVGRYRRLTVAEREAIEDGVADELSIREIARRIGRDPSTVLRELGRNRVVRHPVRYRAEYRPGYRRVGRPGRARYRARLAQQRAERQARRPKPSKLAVNPRLRELVQERLDAKHSPEQIARRLLRDFPGDPELRVSHETIYRALFVQGRGALRRELTACLRTGRAVRRPRRSIGQRDTQRRESRIPGLVSISERPAEAADRAVPGHWEGDLILGTENKSAIGTLVERATGFVQLLHLPGAHGATQVAEQMITVMSRLPATLRRTLTWDRGTEMTNHAQISAATNLRIYFCDPHAPWQRGSNENTNGLLRQYFPKGTDLSGYHPDYLDYVATQLNNRPRKRLNWDTPAEALDQLLSQHPNPPVLH